MRVAFVVQRCGIEVNGGAESLCLQVASRLAAFWDVEILTTCARDYTTWANWYSPGAANIHGVTTRRFVVDSPRDPKRFDDLSAKLLQRGANAGIAEQEEWMRAQGPLSTALFSYLESSRDNYDAFIFFGYLYATTYFGLALVADKAWLAPLGHDEWPIHLSMWNNFFALPAGFIFQTDEERAFLGRRFPQLSLAGPTAGIGIEPPDVVDTQSFIAKYDISAPYWLYLGRIEPAKGCDELFQFFLRHRAESRLSCKLVLLGQAIQAVPSDENIVHLGFVEEAEKWQALAGCDWLLMPSPHESLSISLLEAWSVGRPALVTAQSDVLVGHCRRSNGGLWYENYAEWGYILSTIDSETRTAMGRSGRAYVAEHYSWSRVEREYLGLFSRVTGSTLAASRNI